jgi:hypothetical protein
MCPEAYSRSLEFLCDLVRKQASQRVRFHGIGPANGSVTSFRISVLHPAAEESSLYPVCLEGPQIGRTDLCSFAPNYAINLGLWG